MRSLFAALLIFLFAPTSMLYAQSSAPAPNLEKFCIENEATFNQYKALLPSYFQNLPVYIGAQTTVFTIDVIAVLNIGFKNDTMVLKSDVWKLGARYTDEQEIKKVCFDRKKKKMQISFNNNKDPMDVKYREEGFSTDGVMLTRLSAVQRQAYADKIIQKENDKNGIITPAPSAPAPAEVGR